MGFLDFFRGSRDERIARQYIKALRDAGERRRLEYDSGERVVIAFDDKGHRTQLSYLGNLTREIVAADAAVHEAIYRRYALSAVDQADGERASDYGLVKQRLRILLKDSSYPEYIWLLNENDFPNGAKQSPLVFERVAGDVIACCIEEREQGLRFVTQEDLTSWSVDAARALSDAKANVCALPYTVSDPNPARYVLNDDSFIASRFVNPRMFEGLQVRGEWVAVVPDRDTLFLADSEDLETVAGLARLAQRQLEAGERIISGLPFVLRGGRWEVYKPPESIRALFSNVALQYRAKYWADFKVELQKSLLRRGQDIFVADIMLREVAGIDIQFSMAAWSKDVDTILPAVDKVAFYDDEKKATRIALWPDVVRVMGTEMHREAGLPERYRVQSFPSAQQLVAMGAKSL